MVCRLQLGMAMLRACARAHRAAPGCSLSCVHTGCSGWRQPMSTSTRVRHQGDNANVRGGGDDHDDGSGPDAVYGFHAVASALQARRRRGHKLLVDSRAFSAHSDSKRHGRYARVCSDAALAAAVPVVHAKTALLDSAAKSKPHQGVVLICDPLPMLPPPDASLFADDVPDGWPVGGACVCLDDTHQCLWRNEIIQSPPSVHCSYPHFPIHFRRLFPSLVISASRCI